MDSIGHCNTSLFCEGKELIKGFGGRFPSEGLAGPGVEREGDGVESAAGVAGEVCPAWEVVVQQTVGVLVGADLPGRIGVTEPDVDVGCELELRMLGGLESLVSGQRAAQLEFHPLSRQRGFGCRAATAGAVGRSLS